MSALFQITVYRGTDDKQAIRRTNDGLVQWRIYAFSFAQSYGGNAPMQENTKVYKYSTP